MATILDKDLIRESTVRVEDREIQVTLTADQMISFKLKGMKSGSLSIGIGELYKQLRGGDESLVAESVVIEKPKIGMVSIKKKDSGDDSPMISLNRLRSMNLVTHMDYKIKLELERVICDLLKKEITLTEEI